MIKIAIDAMSGDFGPATTVPACVRALSFLPDTQLLLVGNTSLISQYLATIELSDEQRERLQIVPAAAVVAMSDKPAHVLRHKQDSSLYVALQLLAQQKVNACVSAGNTGALLAVGCHLLPPFVGINRPAITAALPSANGQTLLLDVGANVTADADNLYQFAVMGQILARALFDKASPRVGLLNIGSEATKGTSTIQLAAQLIKDDPELNYAGFVEADQLFFDAVDVAVCDGFSGNVALKASEGAARLLRQRLADVLKITEGELIPKAVGDHLAGFHTQMNPTRYNGASFLGLPATVVKSHGNANAEAFANAIAVAHYEVVHGVPQAIGERLAARQPPARV